MIYHGRGPRSTRNYSSNFRSNRNSRRFVAPHISPNRYVNQATEQVADPTLSFTQTSFTELSLLPEIVKNVINHGYELVTPIQAKAIPAMLNNKDFVGIANTGTGKTAAFLLPLIQHMIKDPQAGSLIVAPTRELAQQIADECRAFGRGLPIQVALCVGGTALKSQINLVSQNPNFIVGTPGRLKDLINRRAILTQLYDHVVLDEVDRMLDIGFIHDIKFIISQLPEKRQSCFFSATINQDARQIMDSFLKNPEVVNVVTQRVSTQIHQDVINIEPTMQKATVLVELLQKSEFSRVLVFGRTKHGINKLEKHLVLQGFRVSAIHGNKSQAARQRSLAMFRQGRTQALLATDVAARGIDIDDVSHVINFDEPNTYEDYVHRIGRTGRAGKLGKAITFVQR